jgi:hypothetical protein
MPRGVSTIGKNRHLGGSPDAEDELRTRVGGIVVDGIRRSSIGRESEAIDVACSSYEHGD